MCVVQRYGVRTKDVAQIAIYRPRDKNIFSIHLKNFSIKKEFIGNEKMKERIIKK